MIENSKEMYSDSLEKIQQKILRKTFYSRAPQQLSLIDITKLSTTSKRRPINSEMNMKMNQMFKNFQSSLSLNGVWGLPRKRLEN